MRRSPVAAVLVRRTCYLLPATPAAFAQEFLMQLKFIVAVLAIIALPLSAHAQPKKEQSAPKPTKASAQKVVQMISADKAKTDKYCEIAALSDQVEQAMQKKDEKKADELSQKAEEMQAQLGPEFVALM